MAKACASQGAENTGAPSSPRGIGATPAAARLSPSGRLKIALPGVDRDDERRVGLLAPQLRPGEAHGIEPLRVLALPGRSRIREDMGAMDTFDETALAAGVARQPRVAGRVHDAGHDAVADRETRRLLGGTLGRAALGERRRRVLRLEHARDRLRGAESLAGLELVVGDEPLAQHELFQALGPDLIIARGQVVRRVEALARGAARVDPPRTGRAHGERDAESAALPVGVEPGLVRLVADPPEPHHPAEVLRAVHARTTWSGRSACATPILEPRATRPASASSRQPCVPSAP